MNSPSISSKQSMVNLSSNCTSIQKFTIFVNNVKIEQIDISYTPVKQLLMNFQMRAILPVQKLCMRQINQGNIFTTLHWIFLDHAIKLHCWFEALPVISAQAFHWNMDSGDKMNFTYNSFIVYLKLQMYEKAYKKIQQLVSKEYYHKKMSNFVVYLLMSRLMNYPVTNREILDRYLEGREGMHQAFDRKKTEILQNFYAFAQGRQQNVKKSVLEEYINSENNTTPELKFLYNACEQTLFRIRAAINNQMLNKIQRVNIKPTSNNNLAKLSLPQDMLKNPEKIREINKFRYLIKYDLKDGFIYINHQQGTEKDINELISNCYNLNESLKTYKRLAGNMDGRMRSNYFHGSMETSGKKGFMGLMKGIMM